MPACSPDELAAIRARLHRDAVWSVYALGDLDPRRERFCEWYRHGTSIALLYREFDTPILWADGEPEVLEALPAVEDCLLQVPEHFLDAIHGRFAVEWTYLMHRMSLDAGAFVPHRGAAEAEPLGLADEDALRALFADGTETGEAPDFFMRDQLVDGTFVGVRREGRLVAAAGTHLYSAAERVGAIGNVYTHRAVRGQGLAAAVTSAVVERLMARDTRTIALNVKHDNRAAIRVYTRLGFRVHVRFLEGRATARRASP